MSPVTALMRAGMFVLLTSGCVSGPRVRDLQPAQMAAGAQVRIVVRDHSDPLGGELFTADAEGIVLRDGRLMRIPWSRLYDLDVLDAGTTFDVSQGRFEPAARHRIALLSRYPQGLPEPLLARVLAILRQDAIDELP